MTREQLSRITTGAALVTVGVALLAGQVDSPLTHLKRLWPVGLLIIGLPKLVVGDRDGTRSGGVWLTSFGVIFLLHTYRVLTLRQSWPLLLVALGASLLLESLVPAARRDQAARARDQVEKGA